MTKWFRFNYIKAGVRIVYLVLATLSAIPKRIELEKKTDKNLPRLKSFLRVSLSL